MNKIRVLHSPISLRVSLTQTLVSSVTQKGKEKNSHFSLFEQNYLCIRDPSLFIAREGGGGGVFVVFV